MSSHYRQIVRELKEVADPERARHSLRYFKCGPGEYGEGDQFLGVRVPEVRRLARRHRTLELGQVAELLNSPLHEVRLLALVVLVNRFKAAEVSERRTIYRLYIDSTQVINNWDLVDTSAPHIVGGWLYGRSRRPLYRMARSKSLWERRIAIIATFHFIDRDDFNDSLELAERLLDDEHDLIHKAVGWALREIGKRDRAVEEQYLSTYYQQMPRTMLRYAIEHFSERRRQAYLKGRI